MTPEEFKHRWTACFMKAMTDDNYPEEDARAAAAKCWESYQDIEQDEASGATVFVDLDPEESAQADYEEWLTSLDDDPDIDGWDQEDADHGYGDDEDSGGEDDGFGFPFGP